MISLLEIPEAHTVVKQLSGIIIGKKIVRVVANSSPHGFAFYNGDPSGYDAMFSGRTVTGVNAWGGLVDINAGDFGIILGEGTNIRYIHSRDDLPKKHQLLIEFGDSTFIVCTVQMYGSMWAYEKGTEHDFYHKVAMEKPGPLTDAFDLAYFMDLFEGSDKKLSAKAFLATEQRIPGLGNGCIQDILFVSGINPKTKIEALGDSDVRRLFDNVKGVLADMAGKGGRDVEKDLFGNPGGYGTILSSRTYREPCPVCGSDIVRQAYLGGNVYYCSVCQPQTVKINR